MDIKLSVVIITFNEEKNILRCIDSVIDIADEIVVVDSDSTDHTRQLCLSRNVSFYNQNFLGYIEQKNFAITKAKYPHVLSLDADEALSDELKKSILEAKNNWQFDGYSMNRLTNYCGQFIYHCGWYPDTKLRLWDSRKGRWEGINPHDKYELEKNSTTKHLKGDLLHYSYYTLTDHINQVNKFTDVSSKALFEKGQNASTIKLYFSPFLKFIKDYFIKMGFLDGFNGFAISLISAHATFIKYAKLKQLNSNKK